MWYNCKSRNFKCGVDKIMLDRLNFIENKYDELSVKISDPSVMADQKEWQKLCKEHAELSYSY